MAKLKFLIPLLFFSCATFPEQETYTLDDIRQDTAYISQLDSLAAQAIGEGARCIDPVWHLFSFEGGTWFFGEDWGGVLEIPSNFTPVDDLTQAELSFHGTRAYSPDSIVTMEFWAGYQPDSVARFESSIHELFDGDLVTGFKTKKDTVAFPDGTLSPSITIDATFDDGSLCHVRYIYADGSKVTYRASTAYLPDSRSSLMDSIFLMIDRFPFGPDGSHFKGLAL